MNLLATFENTYNVYHMGYTKLEVQLAAIWHHAGPPTGCTLNATSGFVACVYTPMSLKREICLQFTGNVAKISGS